MLNPDETMAKELDAIVNADLGKEFPNAKLKHQSPLPKPNGAATTVSEDLEALKVKLDTIIRGAEMLRAQL
jgi:hypothetical protein